MRRKWNLPLQFKITLLVCGVSILCLLVTNYFIQRNVEKTIVEQIEDKAKGVSRSAAINPVFIDALSENVSNTDVQQYAEKIRKTTGVRFLVVLDMNGIRKSHPDPEMVGLEYAGGDATNVFKGQEYTSIAVGTLGESLRYFTPVYDHSGKKQIGAILVGVLLDDVEKKVWESTELILMSMLFGLVIGLIGAIMLGKKVKSILFGMEPAEIANLLEQRSAVVEHAREGVIALGSDSTITLINQEAARLLESMGIKEELIGFHFHDVLPQLPISSILEKGEKLLDQEYSIRGVTIVTNIVPIYVDGMITGAVATFRDKTEIKQLADQLTGAKVYAEALRSQTHEFMNKLHVILGLVQMEIYDQLGEYVKRISHSFQSEVGYLTFRVKDPVVAGFMIGKASYARERGATFEVTENSLVPKSKDPAMVQDVITIIGNLIDNSLDALKGCKEKNVTVEVFPLGHSKLSITVSDTGTGMNKAIKSMAFRKGFSTKGEDRGLGLYLIKQTTENLGGSIEIDSEIGKGSRIRVIIPFEGKDEE